MRITPYQNYKDSGVEWLGEVPTHWKICRAKTLFQSINIRSNIGNEELLTVSAARGIIPRKFAKVTMFKAESYIGYKLCWPGDLVINSLWAWARGLGVSKHHGIVSSAYGVYRLSSKSKCYEGFVHELVRSTSFQWELQVRSKGIWISRLQLTDEEFLGAPFPVPPLTEQRAIVRCLDYFDRRIQRYVWAKQGLIKLLEEQKKAVIHRVVTRGLDPDVPLKPSGVEWLGDVPAHWEVRQLGRFGQFSKGSGDTKEDDVADGVPCIRYGDLYTQHQFFIRKSRACVIEEKASVYTPIQHGDVLFAGSGETIEEIGKSAVNLISGPACCGGDVILFRSSIEINANFFGYATDCPQATYQKACMGRGITIMHIYSSELKYMYVSLPPLPEQTAIAEYLDKVTADIDAKITHARRQADLMREYRTRLIADVVTGKLDVREAAAELPDEPDEPEACDNPENMMDNGGALDDVAGGIQ